MLIIVQLLQYFYHILYELNSLQFLNNSTVLKDDSIQLEIEFVLDFQENYQHSWLLLSLIDELSLSIDNPYNIPPSIELLSYSSSLLILHSLQILYSLFFPIKIKITQQLLIHFHSHSISLLFVSILSSNHFDSHTTIHYLSHYSFYTSHISK